MSQVLTRAKRETLGFACFFLICGTELLCHLQQLHEELSCFSVRSLTRYLGILWYCRDDSLNQLSLSDIKVYKKQGVSRCLKEISFMRNVGYVPLLVLPLIGEKKAFQLSSQVRWLKLQAIVGKKKKILIQYLLLKHLQS